MLENVMNKGVLIEDPAGAHLGRLLSARSSLPATAEAGSSECDPVDGDNLSLASHNLQPTEMEQIEPEPDPFEGAPLGNLVFTRTYSRDKEDGSKESWLECIERCVNGNIALVDEKYIEPGEADRLKDLMYRRILLPGGRHLWASGTTSMALQNCFRAGWNHGFQSHVAFVFDQLMRGGGVGANYSSSYFEKMPRFLSRIQPRFVCAETHADYEAMAALDLFETATDDPHLTVRVQVPDSREGWVYALEQLVWHSINSVPLTLVFDVSMVRCMGSPIRGFGGTAGGPAPLMLMLLEVSKLLEGQRGKRPTPLFAMEVDHQIATCVVAGNLRRSARMGIVHWQDPEIFDFIHCKEDHTKHWSTNISVEVDQDFFDALERMDQHANDVLDHIIRGMLRNGEPGIYNSTLASEGETGDVRATNPCVTGDTLVALADGRGSVPIKELAASGNDVPVYCYDEINKEVVIRMMRHPRLTGEQVPVVKVSLDDGTDVTVTPNHKFVLTDGRLVEAGDLQPSDSIRSMSRWQQRYQQVGKAPYWHLTGSSVGSRGEHRLIAQFATGLPVRPGDVVHHIDFNSLNNDPSNLRVMSKVDHDRLHGDRMLGDNNPMRRAHEEWTDEQWAKYRLKMSASLTGSLNGRAYSVSNDELRKRSIFETKQLGRRLSNDEWQAIAKREGLPVAFSGWRSAALEGGVTGLLHWAALEAEVEHIDLDPRTVRYFKSVLAQGYDAYIVDGRIVYHKICEICDESFETSVRESSVHIGCVNAKTWANPDVASRRKAGMAIARTTRKQAIAEKQLAVFRDLQSVFGRKPLRREWATECKRLSVSSEVSRKSSPFTSWAALKEAAESFNHRVVSVTSAGVSDVYNGTVDEFHNFFFGGWETTTKAGLPKYLYLLGRNCGELALESEESCILGHANLAMGTEAERDEAFRLMARFLVRTTCAPIQDPKQREVVQRNRRIGVGFFGLQEYMAREDLSYNDDLETLSPLVHNLQDWKSIVRTAADKYAAEMQIPAPIKVTTVAPTGTIAKLAGTTEGVQPIFARHFIRRIRYATNDPGCPTQYPVEPDLYSSGTVVVSVPCEDPVVSRVNGKEHLLVDAAELSPDKALQLQALIQEHYTDNSISHTVNVLEGSTSPEDLRATLLKYLPRLKGTTIMVDSTRPQSPYERISKEQYLELRRLGQVQYSTTDDSLIEGCVGGACPIK